MTKRSKEYEENFAVFILTHGRADNMLTYDMIIKSGYTGKIYFIIDNEDKTADRYYEKYGDKVIMFDKKEIAEKIDFMNNERERRTAIIFARHACYEIAKKLGIKYFLQLDDDYTHFSFRINGQREYPSGKYIVITKLDDVFEATLNYYIQTPFTTIAYTQGGDWFGGGTNFNKRPKRKAMNTFFCSTDRPVNFLGFANEDVNAYTLLQQQGDSFMSIPFISVNQASTQSISGGMTEVYLESGTYIKSFYTIMCAPSCSIITLMGVTKRRLHHEINWGTTAPKILSNKYKK